MGVAFLVGPDLIRADVEHVREPGMTPYEVDRKAERVIGHWIARYQPEILAVEATFFAQSKRSRQLKRLMKTITALGRRTKLSVRLYPPAPVRRLICRNGRPTRLSAARVIATDYFPWLFPYYEKESKKSWWRKRYWTGMFDAIAVGLACYRESAEARHHHQAA